MNIKTRILVFVVCFELLAYTSLQIFNTIIYQRALNNFKQNEIRAVFNNSINHIENLAASMEQQAINLAIAGEQLFELKNTTQLELEVFSATVQKTLLDNFRAFPAAIGGGIWYEPYTLDPNIELYGPYVYRNLGEVEFTWDLNTPEYNYPQQDWYLMAAEANWGLEQTSFRPIFWTEPYRDDSGSLSLMMTVDAVMLDENRRPLGMATVDWALDELTTTLARVKVTENATSFLLHAHSGKILSYARNPSLIMQNADYLEWSRGELLTAGAGFHEFESSEGLSERHYIFYQGTESGFVFGTLVPVSDLQMQVRQVSNLTFMIGSSIGLLFVLTMIFILKWLFTPFDHVLSTIQRSIRYQGDEKVELSAIHYEKRNEFTPIIRALNSVYDQIQGYVNAITETNQQLRASQAEIQQLNKELEKKVAQRTAELESKTLEVTESLEKLQETQDLLIQNEKHAALGRLVAGIAHQINTPLGICITAASTLQSVAKDIHDKTNTGTITRSEFENAYARIDETIELMNANLSRAANLVASFKQVSVEQSEQSKRAFKLGEFINNILISLHSRVEKSGHHVQFTYKTDPEIIAPPSAITQVITQLVENALTHAFSEDSAGILDIYLEQDAEEIRLVAFDNGQGIDADTLKKIFDPFFTTKSNQMNSGLGLHIVYNIVTQQLGGHIECWSEAGSGTRFTIHIPIKNAN
ncbi:MAG: two-component signal transduction system histidine kinase [Idiomarinaceae bacterium HL-53]|nr:MAG: two-component signal transduction system histidine kinase [Idiomarinaceae bacterium HL-53]CUS49481.1 Cache domain-containing protein [Idiomarinaceae bacterium HL-53]